MRRLRMTAILAVVLLTAAASAAAAAPMWRIDSVANTTAAPGENLTYIIQITNVGDASANDSDLDGNPDGTIAFTGTLERGLTVVSGPTGWDCSTLVVGAQTFTCQTSEIFAPWQAMRTAVVVAVGSNTSGVLTARFDVEGGDASNPGLSSSTADPTTSTSALPEFGVDAFDAQVVADEVGTAFTQAAGHPFAATTAMDFNTYTNPHPLKGEAWPVEPVKDIVVDLPPGFVGNPTGIARCDLAQLANGANIIARALCPSAAQVGTTLVKLSGGPNARPKVTVGPVPVFNMVPPPDVPARFGFNALGTVVTLDAELRSATDYGLSVRVHNVSEGLAVQGTSLTFWGVPADPVHDRERACPGESAPWENGRTCSSGVARTAFLRNPTSCPPPGVGLPTTARIASWVDPGDFKSATFVSHLPNGYPFAPQDWGPPQGPTGCDKVPFDPRLTARPLNTSAGKPSGFEFDLSIPQSDDPNSIGQSDLKKAVVTLPLGVHVSPSSAGGLAGCTPAQLGLHTTADPTCPDGSKLGSVRIETPLLDRPLDGAIYLAGPHDNPFDTLLAVYLVARGPGLIVKLAGRVESDPLTGQISTTFDDNPQTPFSNLHLEFKDGPRAPLVNPTACGTYTTHAELTGWSGKIATSDSSFTLSHDGRGAPCPASHFAPSFSASTESPRGGSSSPFHLRVTREDDDQQIGGLTVNMPNGLTGKIADTSLCSEAAARAGTCGDASKVGSVTVGAGAGSNPFYITNGRAYITGPYKGAPFGLSIVVPAVAGPFDLGNVVVRAAIFVDRHSAALRIDSDPLPTILDGIPLDVRDIRVAVDRPGFFLNPTSCAEKTIRGVIGSTQGAEAAVSDRFQAAECRSLSLRPKMTLTVGGRGRTARNASTPFTATLTMPPGGANLRTVRVSLPTTINARLPVINRACTRAQFEAGRCDGARAGSAVAVTPLLREPLRGNAYFVRNGHPLPDLFVSLRGQVAFDLIGRVSIPGSKHLATTFDAVPDVPITSFTLKLVAGRQGPVGNATNLCSRRGKRMPAAISFTGQNGLQLERNQRLVIRGCAQPHRARSNR